MVSKQELIEKYKNQKDYLAIASILKVVLYEVNFEENYAFGATIRHGGEKDYFLRHLEVDNENYIYFSLHNIKHYRKDFQYLHEPPMPPEGYQGKVRTE